VYSFLSTAPTKRRGEREDRERKRGKKKEKGANPSLVSLIPNIPPAPDVVRGGKGRKTLEEEGGKYRGVLFSTLPPPSMKKRGKESGGSAQYRFSPIVKRGKEKWTIGGGGGKKEGLTDSRACFIIRRRGPCPKREDEGKGGEKAIKLPHLILLTFLSP